MNFSPVRFFLNFLFRKEQKREKESERERERESAQRESARERERAPERERERIMPRELRSGKKVGEDDPPKQSKQRKQQKPKKKQQQKKNEVTDGESLVEREDEGVSTQILQRLSAYLGQQNQNSARENRENSPSRPSTSSQAASALKTKRKKKKKKKKRYKPKAVNEIRYYQQTTDLLINRAPFQRLVRELTAKVEGSLSTDAQENKEEAKLSLGQNNKKKGDKTIKNLCTSSLQYRWQAEAIYALQEATESYITEVRQTRLNRRGGWCFPQQQQKKI